jgi:hypothetical protein
MSAFVGERNLDVIKMHGTTIKTNMELYPPPCICLHLAYRDNLLFIVFTFDMKQCVENLIC